MSAGLIGVPLGSYLAQHFRPTVPKIDPQICALGLFISAPFVYLAIVVAPTHGTWCYTFVFLAQVALNLTWSIVADILLVRKTAKTKKKQRANFEKKIISIRKTKFFFSFVFFFTESHLFLEL